MLNPQLRKQPYQETCGGLIWDSLMKDLISYIVSKLVDHPDDIEVTEREEGDTIIIELRVAKDDLGKVIGKQGRTAKAMRSVLSAAAGKLEKRSRLEILE